MIKHPKSRDKIQPRDKPTSIIDQETNAGINSQFIFAAPTQGAK
jgi:hypothetical protein